MSWPASIVIPLLRQRDDWLQRAIDSALAQTVPAEVVVITSPHTPPTNLAVLERCGDTGGRLVVALRTRDGFANALNTGFALAQAPRVGWLMSDDWLESDAVEQCLALDADIVSTGVMRFTSDGASIPDLRRALAEDRYASCRTLEEKAAYLTHFFLFRSATVAAVGGLDESLGDAPGIDDYDFIWTLLEHGASVKLAARPLYNVTIHDGERLTMRSAEVQLQALERIFDKHGFTGALREQRIRESARWFGRPEDAVHAELQAEIRH